MGALVKKKSEAPLKPQKALLKRQKRKAFSKRQYTQ
jgi:hypothetical protein